MIGRVQNLKNNNYTKFFTSKFYKCKHAHQHNQDGSFIFSSIDNFFITKIIPVDESLETNLSNMAGARESQLSYLIFLSNLFGAESLISFHTHKQLSNLFYLIF